MSFKMPSPQLARFALACLTLAMLHCLVSPAIAQTKADPSAAKQDELGRDYYLYAPAQVDPKKTYWLVVGVHGYGGNGKGAAGLASWSRKGDCIVLGPSFPNQGYQLLEKQSDEQLVKLIESLSKQYKLHPKVFVYGFSGGAQFAHRFLMKYPKLVAGCSAHSAGSWATGEPWMSVNPDAADVPLVISCGEKDTDKMAPAAPFGRYEWARAFEKQIADAGFCFEAKYWPNVGHAATPGVATMTEDCYRLATQVIPANDLRLDEVRKLIDAGKLPEARSAIAKAKLAMPKPVTELSKRVAERQKKAWVELEAKSK